MSHNKKILSETLKAWLPLAAVIVIFSGLIFAAVQQSHRSMANDPQIQIAQDVADAIAQGTPPDSIVPPTGSTDLRKSLSPFVMIYDDSNKLVGSSAILDGKNPDYPTGVLDDVKKHGEARVTWQPVAGVRMATVVTRYTGTESGFVIVGRSLKEVENRVNQLTTMTAIAMAVALILSLLLKFLSKKMERLHGEHHEHAEIVFDSTKES